MGIPGLWDILRPAKREVSLLRLTMDGMAPKHGTRVGYRVGIDASIWFYHATYGREGENHELRFIFYRLAQLLKLPACLPIFVFDGPSRPAFKRGKSIAKKQHWLENGMKRLIKAFGFFWVEAPGEAEAELAYLNEIGVIDAVMTDDVDALAFGASAVIRNLAAKGSPRTKKMASDDGAHVALYQASDIGASDGTVRLSRSGMVLIALLSGGDYDKGIPGCGIQLSYALARCGFGEELVRIGASEDSEPVTRDRLRKWRILLKAELRTNSQKQLGRSYPSIANILSDTFPKINVLRAYTTPVTTKTVGGTINPSTLLLSQPDVAEIGACCELYFEWGSRDTILHRFRDLIWPGICGRVLSSNVQVSEAEDQPHLANLFIRIHSERQHASTDMLLEYRVEVAPAELATQAVSTLKGTREPSFTITTSANQSSSFRAWFPATLARAAIPGLVADFEERKKTRFEKEARAHLGKRKKQAKELKYVGSVKRKKGEKGQMSQGASSIKYIIISDDSDDSSGSVAKYK